MNNREFFDNVVLMRKYQKDWFKYHRRDALEKSKEIERKIDAEIERVNGILGINKPQGKQMSLFDDNTPGNKPQ